MTKNEKDLATRVRDKLAENAKEAVQYQKVLRELGALTATDQITIEDVEYMVIAAVDGRDGMFCAVTTESLMRDMPESGALAVPMHLILHKRTIEVSKLILSDPEKFYQLVENAVGEGT